jgi:hypothetical protein
MNQPQQTTVVHQSHFPTLTRILYLVACILFVIASLAAGTVLHGWTWEPWMLGGFAAIALGWAVA